MAKYLFADFETSGLIKSTVLPLSKQPHSIEYYGCIVDSESMEIESDLDLLIKPPVQISKEITKITSIKPEDVVNSPTFSEVSPQIKEQVEQCSRMVCHNASYDGQILAFEFQRLNVPIKIPKLFCTVEQSFHLTGIRQSLSNLHEYLFGEKFIGSHRAKVDVHALLRCYKELVNRGEIA